MPYQIFSPPPGIFNDGTAYSAKGKWFICDKVRFKENFPQKIGGWVNSSGSVAFSGVCRYLQSWADLSGNPQLGIGTSSRFYVKNNGTMVDATPVRTTINLGSNPITTPASGNIITLAVAGHGAAVGDAFYLTGVSGSWGGVTAAQFNCTGMATEFVVNTVVNSNTITFIGPTATSSVAGGGGSVVATFQLASNNSGGNAVRIWSGDNFGQDSIMNYRGGPIYYWTLSSTFLSPMVNIGSLSGASDTPIIANWILVAASSRQVFAFGCNPVGSSTQDPMYVRWSDLESASVWTPDTTNAAGGFRLSSGSQIYCAHVASGQLLVWTDNTLYALLYVGGSLEWGQQVVSPSIDIIGPNSVCTFANFAIWMGRQNFYIYDGTVHTMDCSVREYVFGNINVNQGFKVFASTNALHREVWFFYPSAGSNECNSYVVYNYVTQTWYVGTMPRTAWHDSGVENYPQGASTDGFIYYHENGLDDGSTGSAIDAYIESGPVEIADGDDFVFLSRIIPDITFSESTITYPSVNYTVTARDYPGGVFFNPDQLPVSKTSTSGVEQFTNRLDVRLRGRHFIFRVESSSATGVWWRLGPQRFDMQPDGKR